ncbi:MAG: UDP-N-acetylmuramoyl-tripeptide--D-alanyl-D-alanine ligase [Candidatus Thioglobus sp.]|uniref:UDP-N-acetylmuramoyl-tripeptide--D-alanyl-D- alanine ligase n=1 Tax=Candidatus Thioglobus sp. TaxID=2026721 RepID=UPI002616ACCC|nr:UDP-N-acetylmuramoyl-tripeptide--D-alanyl-D-alanine ligase [Candidatus Thioglobus sp.]MDC9726897.1 UDP-N-acetylmuramoyl-tripeptide--D-alanyl-D-alanine ligase [Candidatus Thioglobus sp.]
MLHTDTKTLAKLLNINCDINVEFSGIFTDTRQPMHGGIFLALIGDNFDAHDYLEQAKAMGAVGVIVSKHVATDLPTLLVTDTQEALSKIAKFHLNKLQPKTIAITGSNGKTTTKNLLANILNQVAPTLKTQGNLNNHLGVPMTLLSLEDKHKYAVIEMGANHLGEIKQLRELVTPNIAIVTNTGDAHIGEFGSKENLISAKGEIYSTDSINIVNTNTNYSGDLSFGKGGDVFASNIKQSKFVLNIKSQTIDINLQLIGEHNINNALAASACAAALDVDIQLIKQGLEATQAEPGRLSIIQTKQFTLIDDTYNASPTSIQAALNTLKTYSGELVVVLGDMAELGEDEITLHQQTGALADTITPNFYSFGSLAKHYQAQHFDSQERLTEHLISQHTGATILVKGSRIAKLDQLITLLQK